jgi:hypothetical protein
MGTMSFNKGAVGSRVVERRMKCPHSCVMCDRRSKSAQVNTRLAESAATPL